ncbi:hypothetical protein BH11BAC4_BH11BAC4_04160 [soil metagenome]
MTSNYARWSMEHEVFKNGDILSATMNIDGAWMDTQKRKLMIPTAPIGEIFEAMRRTSNSELIIK